MPLPNITMAKLPQDLYEVQQSWLALSKEQNGRSKMDQLYLEKFASSFAKLFAELPLHGAPQNWERPRALVSILGLSWQPVALMAAWCRPERMLVLGTKKSLKLKPGGEGILSLIARVAEISRDVIEQTEVTDTGESDIYRSVRDFVQRSGISAHQVFIDPTGGKKSMSASAALAGFLMGTPLVYVDYGGYLEDGRIPIAGTEYPRLLMNPLQVLGDLELRDIFNAFNRSDFHEAKILANKLSERLYEPREAQCLAKLASAYLKWDDFQFSEAHKELSSAQDSLTKFSEQGRWLWAKDIRTIIEGNLQALDSLNKIQGKPKEPVSPVPDADERQRLYNENIPLLAWYLSAAERLLGAEKPTEAVMLTYACVERYIDLCLRLDYGLDDENPDYALIRNQLETYHETGRRFFEKYCPREPNGPLMLANGAQMLATLSCRQENQERLTTKDFGWIKGLMALRNKCKYEHGFLPKVPPTKKVQVSLEGAKGLVKRVCDPNTPLDALLESCNFPQLTTLSRNDARHHPE